jgi:hypothetical protein
MTVIYGADTQVFNPYTDYVVRDSLLRNTFFLSGIAQVNPVIQAVVDKGYTFEIPNWDPDLDGDMQYPQEGVPLKANKYSSGKQKGVIHYRSNAWGLSGMAKLPLGVNNDPKAVMYSKVGAKVTNAYQADALATLQGLFGAVGTNNSTAAFAPMSIDSGGSGESDFGHEQLVRTRLLIGEDAANLTTQLGIAIIHSDIYAYLEARQICQYVDARDLPGVTASTAAASALTGGTVVPGDISPAFQVMPRIPVFANTALIVSDNAPRVGSPGSYKYGVYVFRQGAIGQGWQAPLKTEEAYDAMQDGGFGQEVIKVTYGTCMHVLGSSWKGGEQPTTAQLADTANWELKWNSPKQLPVARFTCTCPIYV